MTPGISFPSTDEVNLAIHNMELRLGIALSSDEISQMRERIEALRPPLTQQQASGMPQPLPRRGILDTYAAFNLPRAMEDQGVYGVSPADSLLNSVRQHAERVFNIPRDVHFGHSEVRVGEEQATSDTQDAVVVTNYLRGVEERREEFYDEPAPLNVDTLRRAHDALTRRWHRELDSGDILDPESAPTPVNPPQDAAVVTNYMTQEEFRRRVEDNPRNHRNPPRREVAEENEAPPREERVRVVWGGTVNTLQGMSWTQLMHAGADPMFSVPPEFAAEVTRREELMKQATTATLHRGYEIGYISEEMRTRELQRRINMGDYR